MPQAYFDDEAYMHPKIIAAGDAAVGLWWRSICYSRHNRTRGRIPKNFARGAARGAVAALLRERLWEKDGDNYIVHGYEEWYWSEDGRSDRGKKGAAARWGKDPPDATSTATSSASGNAPSSKPPLRLQVSSTQPCDAPGDVDDDLETRLEAAIAHMADRDLVRLATETGDRPRKPAGWLRAARRNRRSAHAATLTNVLATQPQLSPVKAAEAVDPSIVGPFTRKSQDPADASVAGQRAHAERTGAEFRARQDADNAALEAEQLRARELDALIDALPDAERDELRARAEAEVPAVNGRRAAPAVRAQMRQLIQTADGREVEEHERPAAHAPASLPS